jgi:hypothetical protein
MNDRAVMGKYSMPPKLLQLNLFVTRMDPTCIVPKVHKGGTLQDTDRIHGA